MRGVHFAPVRVFILNRRRVFTLSGFSSYSNKEFRDANPHFSNQFSIVIRITEICENENSSTLHAEMLGLNNYLTLEQELDLEI